MGAVGNDPAHGRQGAGLGRFGEFAHVLDVAELAVLPHRPETRQRIPDARRERILRDRRASETVILAIGLVALCDIVAPAHAGAMQQIGDVRPREMPILALSYR